MCVLMHARMHTYARARTHTHTHLRVFGVGQVEESVLIGSVSILNVIRLQVRVCQKRPCLAVVRIRFHRPLQYVCVCAVSYTHLTLPTILLV